MRSIFTDQQVFISSRKATKKKIKGGKRFSFYFASSWDAFMICYQPKYNHYLNKTEKEKASPLSPGTFSYIFKIRRNILKFQSREPFLVNDASARGGVSQIASASGWLMESEESSINPTNLVLDRKRFRVGTGCIREIVFRMRQTRHNLLWVAESVAHE